MQGMGDLQRIQAVLTRARRRIRTQIAFEALATATVPAVAAELVVLWLWRMSYLPGTTALAAAAGIALAALVIPLSLALRRLPALQVAAQVDRASGLASRLSTACELANAGIDDQHPDTVELMRAAVADGIAAAPRADVKKAAPFRSPRDLKPALAFVLVGLIVAALSFGPGGGSQAAMIPDPNAAPRRDRDDLADKALAPDDLEYPRELLADMQRVADETQDPTLKEFADKLQQLLDKAEKGEMSKQELLSELEKLEKKYMEGADADLDKTMEDLKQAGKELKKEKQTKELGEAMEAGDLQKAKQELEKLAEKIEKGEMKPEEQKRAAEALEKAAKKIEDSQKKQEAKQEKESQQKVDKQKEQVRRLEKKSQENPQDEELKRRLEREKRQLEKLERDREAQKQENQSKRQLERLSRNLKKSAENLRNQKSQASQDMRESAEDMQKIEDELRKVQNQQRSQSQLSDLKEALRRAKPGKGNQRGNQSRAQRLQDFMRRAGGQRGNANAWRPGQRGQGQGQGQGQRGQGLGKGQGQGQGQGQQGQGQQGQGGQPGDGIGDQHDPNLTADATEHYGKTQDQELTGEHGRGPSRKETIITAAQKGFSTQSYKRVYADYQKIVEEVMNQEKVPQGYKYYVKRYFQRIKPQRPGESTP
jgi:hypothetical protein